MTAITKTVAKKVLETVDVGLSSGLGKPIPGQMCVEAAVCYALGLPHGDDPECVAPALRSLKIALNDKEWSSNEARAKGLRRLAVAQLGSKGKLNEKEFLERVVDGVIRKQVPLALRAAALVHLEEEHKLALEAAAKRCETEGSAEAAWSAANAARSAANAAAYAAANAARSARSAARSAAWSADAAAYAARSANAAANAARSAAWSDKVLSDFAEDIVQILVAMGAPGCKWLALT